MKHKLEVQIDSKVMNSVEKHCFSETKLEVGGFLVGHTKDNRTIVTAAYPAQHTRQGQTQLTFTHESWDAIHKEVDNKEGNETLIGWYHSHPGFGIFLSDYDQFIQHSFFADPSHIALVVDPIAGKRGVFVSRDEKIIQVLSEKTSLAALKTKNAEDSIEHKLANRNSFLEKLSTYTLVGALLVVLLFASWLWGRNTGQATSGNAQISFVQVGGISVGYVVTDEKSVNDILKKLSISKSFSGTFLELNPDLKNKAIYKRGKLLQLLLPGQEALRIVRSTGETNTASILSDTSTATKAAG
jgi:proteasome lid subunit RPN8/RPN11